MNVSKAEVLLSMSALSASTDPALNESIDLVFDRIVHMGFNTAKQWAYFLGNLSHESASFVRLQENLNYSAKRLPQVWPSRFKTRSSIKKCAGNPQALANYVYNGRMGNRTGTNDGYFYRGRGFIQVTGTNNYKRAQAAIGMPLVDNPCLMAEDYQVMWLAAADYFSKRKIKGKTLLEHAEAGNDRLICIAINGGTHGLAHRTLLTGVAHNCFGLDEGKFKRPLIRVGQRGSDVRQMQTYLRALGFAIYKLDGIYGKRTAVKVKEYQRHAGLVVDGIVGANTFMALWTAYEKQSDMD